MDRRRFLGAASLTSLTFGVLGPNPFFPSSESRIERLANPELLTILDSEREVLRIGHRYRESNRAEDDADLLRQKIEVAIGPHPLGISQPLRAAITADFEQDNTLQINGWILSVTEARQCALYSLIHS